MSQEVHLRRLLTILPLLAAAGCARAKPPSRAEPIVPKCAAPMIPHLRTQVYFDRSNTADPLNPYAPAEWDRFVKEVLIRFLPAGGNLYDNTGWWRRPNGTTFRGIGRTLQVWAPVSDSTSHRAAVDSVIVQIKERYKHRVVFREEEVVCEGAY
jgi:hypothetical protein